MRALEPGRSLIAAPRGYRIIARMTKALERECEPKLLENFQLLLAALVAHAPLYYQLPRWANGLDPTFVHPSWIQLSPWPVVLYLAAVHPLIWIAILVALFVRICRNYGWKLERWR